MNILIIFVVAMMVVGECKKSRFPVDEISGCGYECSNDNRYCMDKCKSLLAVGGHCSRNWCRCIDLPDDVPTSYSANVCVK
uniref:Neurotoxin LmNaTx8 n=1 Tax=Lychas mucronatus TaxID=172552 RepID=A0A0U1TYR0_LYCMC|nr:neurotoxin LmNaTx8 precursor [Lychas mucronatus]